MFERPSDEPRFGDPYELTAIELPIDDCPWRSPSLRRGFERARLDAGLSFDATFLEPSSDDHANVPPNVPRNQKPEVAPQLQVTLGDAGERDLNDPTNRWSERTRDTYDTTRALVVSVVGADHPLKSISRADVRDLIEVLRFLPRNANKRFPNLTPKEAAERLRQSGEGDTISAANANVYLSNLSSFLNWAVNEEIAERNPARGLRLPDEVAKRDKRNPFSAEQLRLIFNAPLFRGCQDGDRGYATPGAERPQNARYWVPLIALHTGLRLCARTILGGARAHDAALVRLSRGGDGGDRSFEDGKSSRSISARE